MPQPIETAPKDGTVILTDEGFVMYMDQRNWGSPIQHGKWASCDPSGYVFDCADNGPWHVTPKLWEPVPNWITG